MRIVVALAATLLLVSVHPGAAEVPSEGRRFIVAIDGLPPGSVGGDLHGARVLRTSDLLDAALVRVDDESALGRLRADPRVRYVEEDAIGKPAYSPGDPLYGSDDRHHLTTTILADVAWDKTVGDSSAKLALIDTGLDITHEEFAGQARILPGYDYGQGDPVPDDTCGHGTRMAGHMTATANNGKGLAGLAQVTVLPLKIANEHCFTSTFSLAEALRAAADQGAHVAHVPWIISTSVTLGESIRYAHEKGVLIVAASGNRGPCTDCVVEPWRDFPNETVIVSGVRPDLTFGTHQEGPQVDLTAPSYGILTTEPSWSEMGPYSSGGGATSGASGIVAATAALVKSAEPTLTRGQIETRLIMTARDLGPVGHDPKFGHGLLDAARAVWPDPLPSPPAIIFWNVTTDTNRAAVGIVGRSEVTSAEVRVNSGAWKPMTRQSDGKWGAAVDAPALTSTRIQFRAATGAYQDVSSCYTTFFSNPAPDCPPLPEEPPAFAAAFSGAKGNTWWVEVKVTANEPLAGVDARVNGGTWKALEKKSWGAWAKSIHAPDGSIVQFRARSTSGAENLSGCYRWTAATTTSCTGSQEPPPPPPSTGFTATFSSVKGGEWWIETKVTASQTLAGVDARVDGGTWKPLEKKSWGSWAKSIHAPDGSIVQFRARSTSGAENLSGCYRWTAASPTSCGGGTSPPPPPPPTSFDATFSSVKGNDWWVETKVSASEALAGVDARVNGGTWKALEKKDWGAWAKSMSAPEGSKVQFRARSTSGAEDLSGCYRWTAATTTSC